MVFNVVQSDITETGNKDVQAKAMFVFALGFLALFAAILPHGGLAETVSAFLIRNPIALALLFGMWLLIAIEGVVGYLAAPDKPKNAIFRLILVLLIPPFRITISPRYPNKSVWLPKLNWVPTSKTSVDEMEVRTGLPMLFMTLLILPVIAADFLVGPKPHDVLAAEFDVVSRMDTSANDARLFLMDENERVVATLARPDREAREGIDGDWTVLGRPEGKEESTLSFGPSDAFSFTTGCSVTEGVFGAGYGALAFNDLSKIAKCPPSFLEIVMWFITALIWFSFALEFILLVSLAEKKFAFCKKHWINIVIILLPLLAFLRSLQLFRFLRMAKAGKLMRVYRLKGLATRMAKLATIFNLIDRILSRNPEKYDAHLREKISEKEEELAELKGKLSS